MIHSRTLLFIVALLVALPQTVHCQVGGNPGGGVGGGAGGAGGNNQSSAGIRVDADGLMSLVVTDSGSGALDKKRRAAMARNVPGDVNRRTKLRFVSLVQLEKQFQRVLSEQKPISAEMFYFAGLQRVDYLLVLPEEGDVVIAGPAEAYVPDDVGRMVGVTTGRPTLRWDDLVVAVRTLAKSNFLGCSIDPVPERLAELRQFIRQGEPASVEQVEARFQQMDDILGLQDVRIDGVPADCHFATMLVEADYRMKLLAAGLEKPPVKGFKSHLSLMDGKGNTMQRWWFVPAYDAISRSEDGLAYQLIGPRAKLLTEEEVVDENGNRSSAATTRKSAQTFAKNFSEKFTLMADKLPVFAELQNLIDWSVVAALLVKEQIPDRIGWKHELISDAAGFAYPAFETPRKVASVVSYKRAGNMIVGLVSGGVTVHPQQTYGKAVTEASDSKTLGETHLSAVKSRRTESHRWWWDVE